MKKSIVFMLGISFILMAPIVKAQSLPEFELSKEWLSQIEKMAPSKPRIAVNGKKNILIFSLYTGFKHWTIPHTEAVIKLLAEQSGAFTVTVSNDIQAFEKKELKKFDAIILNNNCSIGDRRDLFWDKLQEDTTLDDQGRLKKAQQLEKNLINYVRKGGGLMALHGGIVMQNKSERYGEMLGGSFDYHPKQQKIQVKLVDPDHPLVAAFEHQGFEHTDEPYIFNNAYFDYDFRPLLYMEANSLEGLKEKVNDNIKYISWIKKHGKGRVFYASPSHNAQSMENPRLLQYFLDALQYVTGDLKCDDSPLGR
ncbi:MAG: ThuA domain-containing protein [Saprospiraceae bacterium]